jgi:hypothetical protein
VKRNLTHLNQFEITEKGGKEIKLRAKNDVDAKSKEISEKYISIIP